MQSSGILLSATRKSQLRNFGLSLLLAGLCSCATPGPVNRQLPPTVKMNENAGRGDLLLLPITLADGEKFPFVMDTGCPVTTFDRSLEPKLGARTGTGKFWNFGNAHPLNIYAAPAMFLGRTRLLDSITNVTSVDISQFSHTNNRPERGILGMDVLGHYCIQLDFVSGQVRFLDATTADKSGWGQAFPMSNAGDGCATINENLAGVKNSPSIIDTGDNGDGWLANGVYQQWTNQLQPPANGEARSPNGLLAGQKYHELHLRGIAAGANPIDDGHTRFNGIGLRALARNLVTLDFPNQIIYLKHINDWPLVGQDSETMLKKAMESAAKFTADLQAAGRLPGWLKNEAGTMTDFQLNNVPIPYLDSGTIYCRKNGDSSVYHYTLTRKSRDDLWKLQRAWQTDADGKIIKEFPIP